MKRITLYWIGLSVIASILALMVMTGTVAAQRPDRPTPAATFDRSGPNAQHTPIATANSGTPIAGVGVPLNLTLTPRGTLAAPGSSEEATSTINSFSSTYLGITNDYLNAGTFDAGNTFDNWDALVAKLPDDVQWYIGAFSYMAGVSYWGLFKSGMGMTTVGDCTDNSACIISMDNLNVYLTTASAGVYSVYTSEAAADATDALNMIHAAYPNLKDVALEPLVSDQGYEFQTVIYGTDASNQQVAVSSRLYVAGVIKIGTESLVYAVVAIGDNYVALSQ